MRTELHQELQGKISGKLKKTTLSSTWTQVKDRCLVREESYCTAGSAIREKSCKNMMW